MFWMKTAAVNCATPTGLVVSGRRFKERHFPATGLGRAARLPARGPSARAAGSIRPHVHLWVSYLTSLADSPYAPGLTRLSPPHPACRERNDRGG